MQTRTNREEDGGHRGMPALVYPAVAVSHPKDVLRAFRDEGASLDYDAYQTYMMSKKEDSLKEMFEVAVSANLLAPGDKLAFSLKVTGDHQHMPKEKECLKKFAWELSRQTLRSSSYLTKSSFTAALDELAKEKVRVVAEDGPSFIQRLHTCKEIEEEVGLMPLSPSECFGLDPASYGAELDARIKAAGDLKDFVLDVTQSNMGTAGKRKALHSVFYFTGPKLSDFDPNCPVVPRFISGGMAGTDATQETTTKFGKASWEGDF